MPPRIEPLDASDLLHCERVLKEGSKSFYAASVLLPKRVRESSIVLYTFCRLADDAIDHRKDPLAGAALLARRLDRIYSGTPDDTPEDRAFCRLAREYDIPRVVPDALVEGFLWDAKGVAYETVEDLYAYCARVASTVGVMMTLVMGLRSASALSRACDLGIAMQLTNIARDVGEDARRGRLYLPREWLSDSGIDPAAFLSSPSYSPELGRVVGRLLSHANDFYVRADAGIGQLPRGCRAGIRAARLIYSAIGGRVERARYDSVRHRAVVPTPLKLCLLLRALFPLKAEHDEPSSPAGPAHFLVEATAA